MKIVKAEAMNGDIVEFRKPAEDKYICPVCGAVAFGTLPWVQYGNPTGWLPSFDTCEVCNTEYGFDDAIRSDSESGAQQSFWNELRIQWLDRVGWNPEALKQLRDNLEINIQK